MNNWTAIVEGYLAEGRTVSGGKGDNTLKQQEQAQANFTNTLMQSYKQQFGQQSKILSFLTSKLQPMIDNPTGFSPTALTAMRTSATDTNAIQFGNASAALNDQLAARGGATDLPSGVDAQLRAGLAQAGAQTQAASQNQITLQDEQLKQQNYWNAVNALGGNAAQYNPTGYAGQATSGSQAVGDLGTAYKNSQSSQLLGALGGIAGGVASGFGGGLAKKI
jgi:hypothetical protein